MWWKAFQLTIVAAVVASNIHYGWGWGTSPLAIFVVGIVAAFVATGVLVLLFDLVARWNAKRTRVCLQQGSGDGGAHRIAGRIRHLLRP